MKTVRQVAIPDALWETFAQMAAEMRIEREALIVQAMQVFARTTGYPTPGARAAAPATPPRLPIPDDDAGRQAVAERVLETANALEQAIGDRTPANPLPREPTPAPAGSPRLLYLVGEDGELDKVVKDRFLVGRGKHCDLVIDSAKVSREHAAIVREGADYFIEDLGSSNGTWFERARVQRRRIQDGDEYFICSEKIRCVIR